MKLTITQVTHYSTRKDGTPLEDKHGKPYMRAVIKAREYADQLLSGFIYEPLKEGQEIAADVKEEEYQGKKQLKFQLAKTASAAGAARENLDWLKAALTAITRELIAIRQTLQKVELDEKHPADVTGEDFDPGEIPF